MAKKTFEKEEKKPQNNVSYEAKDIYVLEGLEPVRKRPGMYIGSTGIEGLHHLIWEVVDNSLDEAMAGYAKNIKIEIFKGNRVAITDDGRGIPVDIHPQTKKSALETVMCTLHAGGKFGGESYKVSGGLHGVGVSVVNALSKWMRAEICRDGSLYSQEYERGIPKYKVKKEGKCGASGTKVIFDPDPEIFSKTDFELKKIIDHLRQQAFLTKGVKIEIIDYREEAPNYYSFYFEGGLLSFIDYLNHFRHPIQKEIFYIRKDYENIEVETALVYNNEIETTELSFANNIYTSDGGSHLTGFRSAITRTLNDYARASNYLKASDENLSGDDVREGLVAIVSVKLPEPQFEGQTKARLGTPAARSAVEAVINDALKEFFEKNSADARLIIEKCLLAQKARKAAKAAKETVLRKGVLEGMTLPGKLADCSSRNPEESELFIVEGDSAGGSCKQGRDRRTQAVLPLKGKILNVEKSRIDKMLANNEIKSLVIAMGTAIRDSFDIGKLRYHKIVIMTDADTDGAHIRTLLLTLFYRYFPALIENSHLYIAQPPLYRLQKGKEFKYAYSESDKEKVFKSFGDVSSINVQRYKGLGEMNPEQLWETTLNPENRMFKVVSIEDAQKASELFDILMGENVEPRKAFIQSQATLVKNLDI
ncbi:DNA gyrase subunit B [Candidatus Wolfebacteria bacterium RIFCSPLOWO2_01_FULL_38_11]|uniref:DNA gyrase subunit B n=2 Tax=Candidatus Wolfeibacteriota TaxID=1752735 RepID=A0A0G0FSD1_9BACT|nr:MAG: gyrase subunit B protein [Candidatus Wolfebacteria bacterium GW2011_GWC1_37_10]OGM90512.1 MAG: DNA gyrase subunit B [Candidatus Wolfebacteria bacterium RIFCSPLOWO2_01_FULL_38_11]